MITAKAPTRISLFGGGTDLPSYYKNNGGLVLNFAINKYQHFEYKQSDEPLVVNSPLPQGAKEDFYIKTMKELGVDTGSLTTHFDGSIESGLGTSASAVVAMVGIANELKGYGWDKQEIAEKAWEIENTKLGLFGGKQDQCAASFGGINLIEFGKKTVVHRMKDNFLDKLVPYLNLYDLNKRRADPRIQNNLEKPNINQTAALDEIKKITREGIKSIVAGDIEAIADNIRLSWEMKKKSNSVSNEFIDDIYKLGLEAGAIAGKLLGSGGGGHFLFICNRNKRNALNFEMRFAGITKVDFDIDYQGLVVERSDENKRTDTLWRTGHQTPTTDVVLS